MSEEPMTREEAIELVLNWGGALADEYATSPDEYNAVESAAREALIALGVKPEELP